MAIRHHTPAVINWEITRACNLACAHCGSASGFEREAELDTDQALDVCRQLDAFPKAHVSLTGGEVFVRKDWLRLAEELMERRGALGLQSNGWSLDAERVADLRRLRGKKGRINVGVSLDGDQAAHDRIRKEGSYERVRDAIRLLREAGFGTAVITAINRLNLDSLDHIRDVVVESGCYAWQVQATTGFGRAAEANDLVVDRELYQRIGRKVASLRLGLVKSRAKVRLMTADSIGYMGKLEKFLRPRPWAGCTAGLHAMAIQSNGDVAGCLFLLDDAFVEGNVRETTLREIWDREGAFAYNRGFEPDQLEGPCAECEHGPRCRAGCHALAFSTHGHVHQAGHCLLAEE